MLDAVAALGPRFVARTRGPLPVEVLDAGERYEVAVPQPGRVVDTLGAGDVVHGAFAAAAAHGSSWRAALEDAVLVASRSVEHAGARGGSPRRRDVRGRGTKVPGRGLLGYISVTKPGGS